MTIKQLQDFTNGIVAEFDQARAMQQSAHEAELGALQGQLDAERESVTRLQAELKAEQTKAAELDSANRTNLTTISRLQRELDAALARIAELEKPPTVPAAPADPNARPTGAGFVALEQINVPLTGPGLRDAIARDLGGAILTLPNGTFRDRDFSQGNMTFRAHPKVAGLIGSGPGTLLGIEPGSSTKAGLIPAQGSGQTVPFYILGVVGDTRGQFRLENLGFAENDVDHIYGTAQIRTNAADGIAKRITGKGCTKGNHWSPPGETFGLNFWRCQRAILEDIDLDGMGFSSSLLGFNNVESTRIVRAKLQGQPYGMPTWWQCGDVYTEDLVSLGGHAGINHERVYGKIHHVRPVVRPDRAKFPNAMHIGYANDQTSGSTMLIEDAEADAGLRNGALMVMNGRTYAGVPQVQPISGLTVKKNGVTLVGIDTSVSGTKPAADPTKNYFIFK